MVARVGELLHSVRTGQPAFDHVHGKALFAYLDDAVDAAATFNDHQTNMTQQDAAAVVSAYDFSEYARVVDVGGGHGALTAAILKACPQTTAVLFDQPAVIEGAKQRLHAEGVVDRCMCIAGDFFVSVPEGGDAYVLKDIVHGWDDDRAMAILPTAVGLCHTPRRTPRECSSSKRSFRRATRHFPASSRISPCCVTGGRERTAKEYEALLTGAGLALTRIVPTSSPASVIEAVPG